ncbi:hypothetical protein PFISCL1PPCAC_4913 [Pristionchus fissidentatus]|uniref:Uncharacterized protein n=1 Tax=Pristionchus fissidentatus TaxID=1538716 RepID=A0AAV5V2N3_9BILA|nr:hypothetical protein PFISCL1PPCAC_4913 [Pristionchus fissidentatus]
MKLLLALLLIGIVGCELGGVVSRSCIGDNCIECSGGMCIERTSVKRPADKSQTIYSTMYQGYGYTICNNGKCRFEHHHKRSVEEISNSLKS